MFIVAVFAYKEQMFRQITAYFDEIIFQEILWVYSPEKPVREFKHAFVKYSVASDPFLSTFNVKFLLDNKLNVSSF